MSDSYDKLQWQAQQLARDHALEKQRDKERKTRERAARNAKRKLERLRRALSENGEITDFEDEFGESVVMRLDKFGSAFHDREKGRPGDALSFAQKRVVASMNKKVKDLKKATSPEEDAQNKGAGDDYERTADRWKNQKSSSFKSKGGFKSKYKSKFTPRVRHVEDDMMTVSAPPRLFQAPPPDAHYTPPPKKPFLRIVGSE